MAWDDAKEQEFRALRQQLFSSFAPPEPAEPTVKQNTSALSDFGTDLKRGIQKLPGAVTGLLDIPVAAATGRAMVSEGWDEIGKLTGFQPGKWADEARAEYSPARQAAMQEAQQAEGVGDTAKAYLSNPSMLAGTVIESLPGVALGGAYARALKGVGSLGGVVRGGIGEGAVMAGSSMENMVDEGADPRVAAGLSSVVGVAGGALGVLGGRLAERIGVLDPDTLVAGGVQAARQPMSLGRRVVGGAISEGLFEEAPQTAVETIAGNVAVGREWDEDLGKNMTVGALAGGVMGGVFNIPGARRPVDVTNDAAAAPQQDLLGDPVASAPADTDTPFDVAALRDEYATLMSQAKEGPKASQAEGRQTVLSPEQLRAITSRMQEIRDTFRANNAPVEALHIDLATKRAKALDAEIGRTEKKYESQLLNAPESAAATADRLTELRQAREALVPYLTPDTGGQMDLFGDAPPAGAAAPVQATQAPVDDPFSELRQAAPSAFMQSGAMRQRAQEAFNRYNEFSDNEIDAAIDQLAKSKDAAAWRIPMLEFIKASRAQENADVQATEMDAPSGAAEGVVAQGSEGVASVRAGADGSVDRATGAPARSSVQSPTLGSTPVQQPTDLTGATNGTETPDAALQGQATAQAEGQAADAAQGQDPALDAPGQADAVQERRDGQGQEGLLTPAAPVTDEERLAAGYVRVVGADGMVQWVAPKGQRETKKLGARAAGESVPFAELSDSDREMVSDFMGLDEFGEVSESVPTLSLREMSAKYGTSHETIAKRLAALGYTNAVRENARAAFDAPVVETSSIGAEGMDAGEMETPTSGDDVVSVEAVAEDLGGASVVDANDLATGNLTVRAGKGAAIDIGAGTGFKKLLAAKVPFSARDEKKQPKWSEAAIAEAIVSGMLTEKQLDSAVLEMKARDTRRLREANERNAKAKKATAKKAKAKAPKEPAVVAADGFNADVETDTDVAAEDLESAAATTRTPEQIAEEAAAQEARRQAAAQREAEEAAKKAAKAARVAAEKKAAVKQILRDPKVQQAGKDWDALKSDYVPSFAELPDRLKLTWAKQYVELTDSFPPDWNQSRQFLEISNAQRSAEQQFEAEDFAAERGAPSEVVAGAAPAVQTGGGSGSGAGVAASTRAEPADPTEARVAALRARGLTDQQTKRLDRIVSRYASGEFDLGRVVDELDTFEQALAFNPTSTAPAQAAPTPAPVVAKKAKRTIDKTAAASDGLKFSKADTIIVDGVARPRTNSNGKPIHSTDEGIRNFWRWFGDSKVVDAQGRPLVVYHGTAGDFDSFRPSRMGTLGPGIYFAFSRADAQAWASRYKGGRVIEAYVRAENPVRLNNTGEASALYDRFAPEGSDADMVLGLRREGYDAAWAVGAAKSAFGDLQPEIAVYDPTQIKSATSNVGSYDPNDSRIQRSSASAPDQNASVESVRSAIESIATPAGRRKVTVVQYADELVERGILSSTDAQGTQGFVDKQGNAFFIAENIPAGAELAVALHEIGAHLGIETILTDEQYRQLVTKIFEWARSDGNTQEAQIARAAIERIDAANLTNEADLAPEVIAYFVEEAVKAGVNPTALNYKSELGRWFRTLWAAFKTALEKLGIVDVDKLTAQNVVDLAYGAAYLELSDPGTRSDPIDKGGRMLFSKNPTPANFFSAMADYSANPKQGFVQHGLGWLTLEQLADRVKSAAVAKYNAVMVKIQKGAKDIIADAAQIDVRWAALSDAQQKALSGVMRNATRLQFDPETDKAPSTEDERELQGEYDKLSEAAKGVYKDVRDFYDGLYKKRKAILMDAAAKGGKAGKNKLEVERMFARLKGPYFPLKRLGHWYSVGMSAELKALMDAAKAGTASKADLKRIELLKKSEQHYVARGHQSAAEAQRSAKELELRLGASYFNTAKEFIGAELASIPDIEKINSYLQAELPPEVRGQVRDMLSQMYFDMLEAHSAMKSQMKRKGYFGEEEDMRRVFASTATAQAHHISRLANTSELSEAMVAVDKEGSGGNVLMRNVYNELVQRTKLALERSENPFVDRVLQFSYFTHLGLSPAFWITNMTQVLTSTLPWLAARHGANTTGRAVTSAYGDVVKMMKDTYAGKGWKDGWRSEFDWTKRFRDGSGESRLFRELLDRNLLDVTMEHDLTAVAEMRYNRKVDDAIKIANMPVRVTEIANRAVTGLAAYRMKFASLAGNANMTEEQKISAAIDHAARAVSDTQLNYSALNTARHMQSILGSKALAKLVMQFRKYQQGMLYLIGSSFYDSFKAEGSNAAETKRLRREARRTLIGMFTMTGLMAGAVGMPLMGTVAAVVNAVASGAGDDDEPYDLEVELRNWLHDLYGKEASDAIMLGLPTLLNADLSKRVGLGDIADPLPFARQGKTVDDTAKNYLFAAAGPAADMTVTMVDGVMKMAEGDVLKGMEGVVPIKAASNMFRSVRFGTEGMTDRNGNLIHGEEKFDAWDLTMRALGFQSMKESDYYAGTKAVQDAKTAVTDARNRLIKEYANAAVKGEPVDVVLQEIAEFNKRNPAQGARIDRSGLLRAVQNRRKMREERNESGLSTAKANEPYLDRARFATS